MRRAVVADQGEVWPGERQEDGDLVGSAGSER